MLTQGVAGSTLGKIPLKAELGLTVLSMSCNNNMHKNMNTGVFVVYPVTVIMCVQASELTSYPRLHLNVLGFIMVKTVFYTYSWLYIQSCGIYTVNLSVPILSTLFVTSFGHCVKYYMILRNQECLPW